LRKPKLALSVFACGRPKPLRNLTPTLAPLLAQVDDLNKDIREAKKLLGEGPQSGVARIAKHQAWIEKIELEMSEAENALEFAEANKAHTQAQVAEAMKAYIETSKEISAEG